MIGGDESAPGEQELPEGWPKGIPYFEALPHARPPEPGEDAREAARLLRWIDEHPRRPPPDREPLEDDPVRLNRLMARLGRTLREGEERRRNG